MKSSIVIATRNPGKLCEFQKLLLPLGSSVLSLNALSLDEEFEEDGLTFAQNARLKAIGYSRLSKFPVLADDSGLEVDALEGLPGIHSARYAGPNASDADRVRKLLKEIGKAGGKRGRPFCVRPCIRQ